ncbi:MAG: FecR family protein [Bacteroidetes bacterium]|nr:FecR family protein [Bacteroidota bacterium]
MQLPDHIWRLLSRYLSGETSVNEEEELTKVLSKDESLQQYLEIISRLWNEKKISSYREKDSDTLAYKAKQIISRANAVAINEIPVITDNQFRLRRKKRTKRILFYFSFTAVLISFLYFFLYNTRTSADFSIAKHEAIISVQNGSRSRSMLPDGTTVWLNAGSKLFYGGDFKGATREVKLEGEAFFDVVKDAEHPFIVHTSGIDIRVLGTAFNVKAYPEDKSVETTLYRGLVKVFRHSDPSHTVVELKPNEKLLLLKEEAANTETKVPVKGRIPVSPTISTSFKVSFIDSTKKESERFETAWLYNRLEFNGDKFDELALKLERWYNINIVFEDEAVKALSFHGSFEKETPEQAFAALQRAVPSFKYKINENDIYISSSQ